VSPPRFLDALKASAVLSGLAALLGLRALFIFGQFLLLRHGTQRFHVESAFVWFVLACVIALVVRARGPDNSRADHPTLTIWFLPLLWALAAALYAPALQVGFLSDDFGLLAQAEHWRIGAVNLALVRPLPMIVWATLETVRSPTAVYHLVNVLLHGTSAFLSGHIILGWVRQRRAGELGALLVLTAPLAVEPVAWCAGLFDVMMTAFAFTTVLVFRAYESAPNNGLLAAAVGTTVAAVMSKETGVVIPGLIICDAMARGSRGFMRSNAFWLILGVSIAYASTRLLLAFGVTSPPITKYVLQRTLFQAFGGLANPWHADVLHAMPILALAYVTIVVGLVLRFVLLTQSRGSLRVPLATCLWILASVAPVVTILWIPGDLQSARYLYLAATGWSGLLCVLALNVPTNDERVQLRVATSAMIGLILLSSYSASQNLRPWLEAAAVRDSILEAAAANDSLRQCPSIAIVDAPDTVRGAYLFRNGIAEAFQRTLGLTVNASAPRQCSFRWDERTRTFAHIGRSEQ
jgi:hypothetical protein